jgi:two-component system cell cycle sensor histidine kinase/response regulator CckA
MLVTGPERVYNATTMIAAAPRGNESVLLVEPDPETRVLAAFMLRRLGYRVTEARSGADAIGIKDEANDFDLLLVEAVMPRLNGHDVAAELRARRPSLQVLLMADTAQARVARRPAARNGIGILSRPFTMASLAAGVRQALDSRKTMTASGRA